MRGAWLLATVLLVTGCPSSPRFGDLRFGPRHFDLDLPAEVIELKSGMVIALVPDDRTNLVSIDVRYKVGAADDPAGRAGMAHLVEHLSFQPLKAELAEAALVYNAYTNHDHTHYGSIGLADRLDDLLELEARRMDPRCDQLDEAVFLRERDVVLEEHAQNAAADRFQDHDRAIWGDDHPYARPVASREIADVTRDEVCRFLDDHYAPNRAILVLTGRFEPDELRARLVDRFGAITRRSTGTRTSIPAPVLGGTRSDHDAAIDRPFVVVSFAAPPEWEDEIAAELAAEYVAEKMARGKRSFFAFAARGGGARAGLLDIAVFLKGEDEIEPAIAKVRRIADDMSRIHRVTASETARARRRNQVLGLFDGFWGRGHWIAERLQYAPGRELFASTLAAIDGYDGRDVVAWAARNLVPARSHVAVFRPAKDAPPAPELTPIASSEREHDLPAQAIPVDPSEANQPLTMSVEAATPVESYQLDNGLRVILVPVAGGRMVDARLIFPVGHDARDRDARVRARWAAHALRDDRSPDVVRYDRERLDWVFGLGTLLDTQVSERSTVFAARGMALFADWHVWRLFWRLEAGVYPDRKSRKRDPDVDEELRATEERVRGSHGGIVEAALFGGDMQLADHRAPIPARVDLEEFRDGFYVPRGATLVVAGGFDAATMRREIDQLFGTWRDREPAAAPRASDPAAPASPRWIAITDHQANPLRVTVGFAGLPAADDRAARDVLAGMLRERLAVVRDGQGATYGIRTRYERRGDLAALRIDGRLDPMRADRALATIFGAIVRLRDGAAGEAADFVRARRRALARALARVGTASDIAEQLETMVVEGLPLDGLDRHAAAIAELTPAAVGAVAARDLAAGTMVVVVSGPGTTARELLEGAGVAAGDITDHAAPD